MTRRRRGVPSERLGVRDEPVVRKAAPGSRELIDWRRLDMASESSGSFQHRSLRQQGYQQYTPQQLTELEWGLRFHADGVCLDRSVWVGHPTTLGAVYRGRVGSLGVPGPGRSSDGPALQPCDPSALPRGSAAAQSVAASSRLSFGCGHEPGGRHAVVIRLDENGLCGGRLSVGAASDCDHDSFLSAVLGV